MRIPGILGRRSPVPSPTARGGAPGGAPAAEELAVAVPHQKQNNWCWAAVATAIGDFYSGAKSQLCSFATRVLAKPVNCCATVPGGPCDEPYYLDTALEEAGCFDRLAAGATAFAAIRGEIDHGRPLGVRVQWPNGEGHFVAVTGWSTGASGEEFVTVQDPWGPKVSRIPVSRLRSAYDVSRGVWTHSYFTTAAPKGGARMTDRKRKRSRELLGG